ncbi:hypothetical protein M0R04_06730 [Candidatus Dojkabacteria bacterium]|jgi:hypothetical protein|nr:hypothetical protein [Candidatus Dojkabacteria bacterium]
MDVRSNQAYYSFVYDPTIYGLNTAFWKELNGSASTVSNKIRLNSVTIVSKHQYLRGKFTFGLTMASAPASGDNKEFGLKNQAIATARNAAYFQISGATVNAITVGPTGTVTTTALNQTAIDAITWTTNNDFSIFWQRNRVIFAVNGITVADITDRNLVPQNIVLPVYIANNVADNESLSYVEMNYVDEVVKPDWELPIVSPAGTTDVTIESTKESLSITENVAIVLVSDISGVDSLTITDVLTSAITVEPNISDALTISEDIGTPVVSTEPNVNDALTITESATVETPELGNIGVNEELTITEGLTVDGPAS